jgi:hypothetical protein
MASSLGSPRGIENDDAFGHCVVGLLRCHQFSIDHRSRPFGCANLDFGVSVVPMKEEV